jgi:hypothetical protein
MIQGIRNHQIENGPLWNATKHVHVQLCAQLASCPFKHPRKLVYILFTRATTQIVGRFEPLVIEYLGKLHVIRIQSSHQWILA